MVLKLRGVGLRSALRVAQELHALDEELGVVGGHGDVGGPQQAAVRVDARDRGDVGVEVSVRHEEALAVQREGGVRADRGR